MRRRGFLGALGAAFVAPKAAIQAMQKVPARYFPEPLLEQALVRPGETVVSLDLGSLESELTWRLIEDAQKAMLTANLEPTRKSCPALNQWRGFDEG